LRLGKTTFALTPEEGAKTLIYLASSPEVADISGAYFYKCKQEAPTAEAQNDADARRLWDISLHLSGLDMDPHVAPSKAAGAR